MDGVHKKDQNEVNFEVAYDGHHMVIKNIFKQFGWSLSIHNLQLTRPHNVIVNSSVVVKSISNG